mmetsp:Transcript_19763/g.27184  ORF Transcript_19763/g.27184 Transcript_19763/m.27184 type:complete len:95 (+) Transcript_19763:287-571(+)
MRLLTSSRLSFFVASPSKWSLFGSDEVGDNHRDLRRCESFHQQDTLREMSPLPSAVGEYNRWSESTITKSNILASKAFDKAFRNVNISLWTLWM